MVPCVWGRAGGGRLGLEVQRVGMLPLGQPAGREDGALRGRWDRSRPSSRLWVSPKTHADPQGRRWCALPVGARCPSARFLALLCAHQDKCLTFPGPVPRLYNDHMAPSLRNPVYPWAAGPAAGRAHSPFLQPKCRGRLGGSHPYPGPAGAPSGSSALGCLHMGAMSLK